MNLAFCYNRHSLQLTKHSCTYYNKLTLIMFWRQNNTHRSPGCYTLTYALLNNFRSEIHLTFKTISGQNKCRIFGSHATFLILLCYGSLHKQFASLYFKKIKEMFLLLHYSPSWVLLAVLGTKLFLLCHVAAMAVLRYLVLFSIKYIHTFSENNCLHLRD